MRSQRKQPGEQWNSHRQCLREREAQIHPASQQIRVRMQGSCTRRQGEYRGAYLESRIFGLHRLADRIQREHWLQKAKERAFEIRLLWFYRYPLPAEPFSCLSCDIPTSQGWTDLR